MLLVKSLILYFFLLVLEVFFNFTLDAIQKYSKFANVLLKNNLKFILYKKSDFFLPILSFMLLVEKVDLITEKQNGIYNL